MRIEQIQRDYYIKTPDVVECYLINALHEKLEQVKPEDRGTIEYIIQQVLLEVNERLTNMNGSVGVLSVNGMAGNVELTAENLNVEPAFEKAGAFNKSFGTKRGTVCEGNDARLSDKRLPLTHAHSMDDLPTDDLREFINHHEKVKANEAARHQHSNETILNRLTYSGNKQVIDLGVIDDFAIYLPQNTTEIVSHLKDDTLHVSAEEKQVWFSKVSNAELTKAINELSEELIEQFGNDLIRLIGSVTDNDAYSFYTLGGAQEAHEKLMKEVSTHTGNSNLHLSTQDRKLLTTIDTKAEKSHQHVEYATYQVRSANDLLKTLTYMD